jgi:hypothetical protein
LRVEPRRTAHVLKLWSVCSMGCAKLASLIDRCIMVVDEYPARLQATKPGPVESGVPGSASDARSIAVGVPANNNIEHIHTEAAEASGSAEPAERRCREETAKSWCCFDRIYRTRGHSDRSADRRLTWAGLSRARLGADVWAARPGPTNQATG